MAKMSKYDPWTLSAIQQFLTENRKIADDHIKRVQNTRLLSDQKGFRGEQLYYESMVKNIDTLFTVSKQLVDDHEKEGGT